MDRKLLIFGNGLGMAIDANHYSLTNALNTVWSDDTLWNNTVHRDHWLSNYGQEFTAATQEYIHTVASYLFDSSNTLPINFKNALIDFIKNTNSHVATLNYDKLLYDEFIKEEICKGYSGYLVDGFYDTGFKPSNIERHFRRNFGYYMHLH